MKIFKNIVFRILLISLLLFLGYAYYTFEKLSNNDFGCGCSSACISFQPTTISKIIGYFLIFSSLIFSFFSVIKLKKYRKLLSIPCIAVFVISNYGNGRYFFNKGACGESINVATFWGFKDFKKIGDFGNLEEMWNYDSLQAGRYNQKILGYNSSNQKNEIKFFRINDTPIIIKTNFLFWKIPQDRIIYFSSGANTYRHFEEKNGKEIYEFIGGKGMTEKDFLEEFTLTHKYLIGRKFKNKSILQEKDGTTRFKFQIE